MSKRIEQADPTTALQTVETHSMTALQLMEKVIEKASGEGSSEMVNAIEKLCELQIKMEDRAAERAYNRALAAFSAECPIIPKNAAIKGKTKSGHNLNIPYASRDQIEALIKPYRVKHGFTHSFTSYTKDGKVRTVCTLRHIDGHATEHEFEAPIDSSMVVNATQQAGAASTYTERQAMKKAYGIVIGGEDMDGTTPQNPTPITAAQVAELKRELSDLDADEEAFLNFMGVDSLDAIMGQDFAKAKGALAQRRKTMEIQRAKARAAAEADADEQGELI